ncbi:hypothetical protein [Maribacter aurantiacus]|uniref:Uncharacterized protein n=1 Tax=Maribacter aurantiacus TaxID=1882343 RepID=A0A5R8M5C9_9FLAO|nr:hypothetical protein [Maribacter aurantiacus]TLF44695.1 hypothetical protein FEK29_10675 [Maribacter aurantiacus]
MKDIPWLKIIITLISISVALLEIWDFKKKEAKNWKKIRKSRKFWIILLFLPLILLTIWDTTSDSIQQAELEKKRDSLITVDSLRAAKIIENLNTAVESIGSTKSEILKIDSLIGGINDSINIQIGLLNRAVEKSKELVDLEKQKLVKDSPNLGVLGNSFKLTKDVKGDGYNVSFTFTNYGGRVANNVRYKCLILVSDENMLRRNVFLSPRGNTWKKSMSIPENNQVYNSIEAKFQVEKEQIKSYDDLYFVIRFKYTDDILRKDFDFNLFYTPRNYHYGVENFFNCDPREERIIKYPLLELGLEQYLVGNN